MINSHVFFKLKTAYGRRISDWSSDLCSSDLVLTSIKQEGEKLTLEGRSQSNARVSTYMRNLEGSGWMTTPELSIIEATGAVKGLPYAFSLTVTLANPNAARDEDGDGVPDAVPPVGEAPVDGAAPAAAATEGAAS